MKILISQKAPANLSQFETIQEKYKAKLDFIPFFLIEAVSDKEFRAQKLNLPDYTAVVFSSRHAIDAFFKIAEMMRYKVPETLKYFCTTELVAMYLQKHIVYRKRKIFYGDGKPESIISLIGPKHKGEKFLITTSVGSNTSALTNLFEKEGLEYNLGVICKSVPQDLSAVKVSAYDMIVMYNPFDVKALFANYPDYRQGKTKMIAYGKSIVASMEEAGLKADAVGPTPEAPSAAKTIELYLASI